MNQQAKFDKSGRIISLGIEWTAAFGPGTGYTWNPYDGCEHECRWRMPDGSIAKCYAEEIAAGLRSPKFFPNGFQQITNHPERYEEPIKHKAPAGIFWGSMADPLGRNVPDEYILEVLRVAAKTPRHRYFMLTKNAPRIGGFDYPSNVWVGASVPPTFMFGKELSLDQQHRMLGKTLKELVDVQATVRWLSAEPLSFDISSLFWEMYYMVPPNQWLNWIIIGAASKGRETYQPDPQWVANLIQICDFMGVSVFFKGNLDWGEWREEWPSWALQYTALNEAGKEIEMRSYASVERKKKHLSFVGEPIAPERLFPDEIPYHVEQAIQRIWA